MSNFLLNKESLDELKRRLSQMAAPTLKPAYALAGPCSSSCAGDCWSCTGSCQGSCDGGCEHSCSGRGQ